jgi:hypothetical protein
VGHSFFGFVDSSTEDGPRVSNTSARLLFLVRWVARLVGVSANMNPVVHRESGFAAAEVWIRTHSQPQRRQTMRKCFAVLGVLFLAGTVSSALAATPEQARELYERASRTGEFLGDIPAKTSSSNFNRAPGDTIFYGYYNGTTGLAVSGYPRNGAAHTWTFDHGAPLPFEGWYATDVTANLSTVFRHITSSIWTGGGNSVPAPILTGAGSAWIGAFETEADGLCWVAGLGYGNSYCQRLTSPSIPYTPGGATLSMDYFNDTEPDFDYTRVLLRRPNGDEVSLNFDGFTDQIGLATDHPTSKPTGVNFVTPISDAVVGAFGSFQLIFEMESDGGWSDQDGSYATEYGPFAADNVVITGGATASYNFDAGLQGWTAAPCAGTGSFFGLRDVALYTVQDPCACELSGNVLEWHADTFQHFYGQRVQTRSNVVDLAGAKTAYGANLSIGAYWDQYSELPSANGVFYRPGWTYFPFLCTETGLTSWSPRRGQGSFNFVGEDPLCTGILNSATGNGIPSASDQVRFLYEIYASCDAFGIPPTDCNGEGATNFTPVIDNINVFATQNIAAPSLTYDNGRQLQDGYGQAFTLSTISPGNSDCTRNVNFGNTPPFVLHDVPLVVGPSGALNAWSAKLHFRVVREGPGAGNAAFANWQAWKTATGVGVGPTSNFANGTMDTFEVAGNPVPNRDQFVGYYREDDPNNPSPGTELVDANEILSDNVPPGTKIEYFVSSKFNTGVDVRTLPDTTGGVFSEFEILPSWRNDAGTDKFPALLYVDQFNRGSQFFIENALEVIYGPPTATDIRGWDRFDYLDGSSNWAAPFARGAVGANNGVPLPQLLGYRAIMWNNGTFDSSGWPEDYSLLSDWLTAVACDGNVNVQGLLMNGDGMGTSVRDGGPGLLNNRLGAGVLSSAYNEDTSGGPADENFCVNLDAPGTALYGTSNGASGAYTYDAWGNWCPNQFAFNVLVTQGTGTGNRVFTNIGTLDETSYAQVANEVVGGGTENYRTVLDGITWHHISSRSGTIGDPQLECASDSASIVTASFNEISAGLEWVFGGAIPGLQVNPCTSVDAPDVPGIESQVVTRLYQNSPNPFNPRTALRFSLAQTAQVELVIYDVNGRQVKTLANERMDAGSHQVDWDGTDNAGRKLAAGVYWSQLRTTADGVETFVGSKKMISLGGE